MTPEEKAVVQAAIKLYLTSRAGNPNVVPGGSAGADLMDAAQALVWACPECNHGGHTCPGDGNSVPHGDTDCGQHDDDKPQPPLRWYPVKWAHVRAGDRIRMQGHEATVLTSTLLRWNVKPGTGTSQYNPPVPESHVVNNLTIDATDKVLRMGPWNDQSHPVEIAMTHEEHEAMMYLGGWEQRLQQIEDAR